MRFLFRLFLLFVVVALVWVFRAPILDRLGPIAGAWARPAGSETRGASGTAERTTRGRLSDLDFSVDSIAQELRATGRVVRRKVVEAGPQLEESSRRARATPAPRRGSRPASPSTRSSRPATSGSTPTTAA